MRLGASNPLSTTTSDVLILPAGPARLAWLELSLSGLESSLRGINNSVASPRQRGEIMGLEDGVHNLTMEVLDMAHASAEEVVLKVVIVAGLEAKVEGLIYSVSVAMVLFFSFAEELTSLSDHPRRQSSSPSCSRSPSSQPSSSRGSSLGFLFFCQFLVTVILPPHESADHLPSCFTGVQGRLTSTRRYFQSCSCS